MDPKFIHLRLHTEFSLSDGLLRIPELMNAAAKDIMPALAMTDNGNLYATVKFYRSAMGSGIKPIIGSDIWLADEKTSAPHSRLTLLCMNNDGYQNLIKIISKSYLEGQGSGQPTVRKQWLTDLSDGLIALSGGMEGDIGKAIIAQDRALANTNLNAWRELFPNRFYIELSRVGKPNENQYIQEVIKLAETNQTPVVATNDVRFLKKADYDAHEARVCIQDGVTLGDPQRSRNYTEQQYLRTQEEMCTLFNDIPSALVNTIEIAKRCNVSLTLGVNKLPHFEVPEGDTTETFIEKVAKKGLNERLSSLYDTSKDEFTETRKRYDERLMRELGVINKMGFAGYFLIVADFTKWSKENGIPVGPGRGSGPGSLVAYAMKITDLDPLAFDLLFERFLNPERVSMPDFDIDFCMDGRDRVIEYVMNRHGHERVSQIITYGTMAAKAVVRDVGRVQALGYGFVDKIAKLIPFELGITLDKALDQEPMLSSRYDEEEEVRTLINMARKLEGITRNVGKHAGGIVIAPGKLTDFVPLYCEAGAPDHPVTQFDKDDVEAVGLVKFDFLGLKTLTIIDRALRIINHDRAKNCENPIDIGLIPLADTKTFDMLKDCRSTAVFQLESHGMRDLIKRLQPDCFEDLIALVALFRPGPLQSGMVEDFIDRKHGKAKVVYPHPDLEPVLKPTYGVIVYQEQVMQIAQILANYTLGAADILRRAMGKKKPEEMAKQRIIFCDGAVSRGVDAEVAGGIFDLMEKFAGYGFNKSHSAAYALIAYQTAWLKAHYPAAFMAAVLSSDMDRTEKVILFLEECEAFNIHVSPPDINRSEYDFEVIDDKTLMYGLGAIKGVGESAIENIVDQRKQNGDYKNIFDLCQRIDLRKVNKRVLEALIKAGTMDSFGKHRACLTATLNKAMQYADQTSKNTSHGQNDLFALDTTANQPEYVECEEYDDYVQLQGEKETLGFYLTGHPLNKYLNEISKFTTCRITDIDPAKHKTARVCGIISGIRLRQTKRGDKIAIFKLDDGTSQVEVVCFSEPFQQYRSLIVEDAIVIAEGDVSIDHFSNSMRFNIREIASIEEARGKNSKQINIHLGDTGLPDPSHLEAILTNYTGGHCPIVIRHTTNNIVTKIKLGNKWLVSPTEELLSLLKEQLTAKSVEVIY